MTKITFEITVDIDDEYKDVAAELCYDDFIDTVKHDNAVIRRIKVKRGKKTEEVR